MEQFTIGGLTAKRGEKVNGFISVEGTRIQLPVTLICGTQEGETVLISGDRIYCCHHPQTMELIYK